MLASSPACWLTSLLVVCPLLPGFSLPVGFSNLVCIAVRQPGVSKVLLARVLRWLGNCRRFRCFGIGSEGATRPRHVVVVHSAYPAGSWSPPLPMEPPYMPPCGCIETVGRSA